MGSGSTRPTSVLLPKKYFISESVIKELDNRPGLIDLFLELDKTTSGSNFKDYEEIANDALYRLDLEDFIIPTDIPNISLIIAERFDEKYRNKVINFKWEQLSLIHVFVEWQNVMDMFSLSHPEPILM